MMNIFAKCKTFKELIEKYKREEYGCETFEWLGKIDRDFSERYTQLMREAEPNRAERKEKII